MLAITTATRDPFLLQHHLAAAGLCLILTHQGITSRVRWEPMSLVVDAECDDPTTVGQAIKAHAEVMGCVLDHDFERSKGRPAPLFSSKALRVEPPPFADEDEAVRYMQAREAALDEIKDDLCMEWIAALGNPLTGFRLAKRWQEFHGKVPVWLGTTPMDMQPPNRGASIITAMRRRRDTIASMDPAEVFASISVAQSTGSFWWGGADDTVESWLALVGIAVMPMKMLSRWGDPPQPAPAATALTPDLVVGAPVWEGPVTAARLKSMWSSVSWELVSAAALGESTTGLWPPHVIGLVAFPTSRHGPVQANFLRVDRGRYVSGGSQLSAPEVWGLGEIADRLGVALVTVRAYRSRGILPPESHMLGRSPMWRREAIEAWIATRPGQGVGGGGLRG